MSTLPKGCTCTVTLPDLYCPLHKAAPDLLVAMREIANGPWSIDGMREIAGHAIDKAEGR